MAAKLVIPGRARRFHGTAQNRFINANASPAANTLDVGSLAERDGNGEIKAIAPLTASLITKPNQFRPWGPSPTAAPGLRGEVNQVRQFSPTSKLFRRERFLSGAGQPPWTEKTTDPSSAPSTAPTLNNAPFCWGAQAVLQT